MIVETTRLGAVEVEASAVLTFPEGLPGFPDKRFALVPSPDGAPVQWLQSLEDPDLALITVAPADLDLEWSPRYKPGETRLIRPGDAPEAGLEWRLIAAEGADGEITLNLLAPLLVNRAAGLAMQLPLLGSGLSARAPWPPSPET